MDQRDQGRHRLHAGSPGRCLNINRSLLAIFFVLILSGSSWSQPDLIGVWESGDELILSAMEFREDGILLQNDYFDGEIECVFAFPYSVDGDQLTIGKGLNWEINPETGEFELYEDFAELDEEIMVTYELSGGELTWTVDNETVAAQLLVSADLFLEMDAADLGVDIDPEAGDVSDEELASLVLAFFREILFDVAVDYGVQPEDIQIEDTDGLADIVTAFSEAIFIATLEDVLGVEIELTEIDLSDVDQLLADLEEELDLQGGAFDTLDRDSLQEQLDAATGIGTSTAELVTDIGEVRLQRSKRWLLGPPEQFTLPNGISAVERRTWGEIKRAQLR